jgi:hypothetical protein
VHRGLVDFNCVGEAGLEAAVERALALSEVECEGLGIAGRAFFLDNDRRFRQGFAAACLGLSPLQ